MKKSITIIFGVMTLMFGLFITSTKIQASEIVDNIHFYYAETAYYVNNDIKVKAPDLNNPSNYKAFVEMFISTYDVGDIAIIRIDTIYIDFEHQNLAKWYEGWIDSIIIEMLVYNGMEYQYTVNTSFYYKGNNVYSYDFYGNDTYDIRMSYTKTSLSDGYADGYANGYEFGYDAGEYDGYANGYEFGYDAGEYDGELDGYKEGVSTVYNDGFGGIINPDTNLPYDVTASFPYTQGYNAGLLESNSYQEGVAAVYYDGFGGLINPDTGLPYDVTASFPYNTGYQEAISTVYYDGFGGLINPDTGLPYDVTASFPYNTGYNACIEVNNDFSFTGILFQVFAGLGALLTIELLPNITIGAIVAVPIVFGIIYFILGKRSGDK